MGGSIPGRGSPSSAGALYFWIRLSVIDCNRLALVIELRLAEPEQLPREITVTNVAGCAGGFDGGEGPLPLFHIAGLRPLLKRGGLGAQRLGGGVESVAIGFAHVDARNRQGNSLGREEYRRS